jgi:hypothetical protein
MVTMGNKVNIATIVTKVTMVSKAIMVTML